MDDGYPIRCPACGHCWRSRSFGGRTTCAECRTRIYVPISDRPAHYAEMGRQLRRSWSDSNHAASRRRAASARAGRARPDDEPGHWADDQWDEDKNDDEPERWDDDEAELWADDAESGRLAARSERRQPATAAAPPTFGDMREVLAGAATRQSSPGPAGQARRPEWRTELMGAPPPSRRAGSPPAAGKSRRRAGSSSQVCWYVAPDQHHGLSGGDVACAHALVLPAHAPTPTLARCPACRVPRIVTGSAPLTYQPPDGLVAHPPTATDLARLDGAAQAT